MVIDFHTHIFPDKIAEKTIAHLSALGGISPFSDGTKAGLLSKMEEAGVDVAVTLPVITNPKQFESVNRYAKEINEEFSSEARKLISFAGIHPLCEDIEGKMKKIKEDGFLGVKIHPDYQETFINDSAYIKIGECAKEYDLILITHAGVDVAYRGCPVRCAPNLALEFIRNVKHKKTVFAHLGGAEMADDVIKYLAGEDVYFDTAYVLRYTSCEIFKKILNIHGADKILFASDSPWSDIKNDVEILKAFSLNEKDEKLIFSDNAMALLGI